jgi:hypothetical protein
VRWLRGDLSQLRRLPNLSSLDLPRRVDVSDLGALADAAPGLRRLVIRDACCIACLWTLRSLTGLTSLCVDNYCGAGLERLADLTSLRALRISAPSTVLDCRHLSHLLQLEALELPACYNQDALAALTGLTHLDMSSSPCTAHEARQLTALCLLRSLSVAFPTWYTRGTTSSLTLHGPESVASLLSSQWDAVDEVQALARLRPVKLVLFSVAVSPCVPDRPAPAFLPACRGWRP